MFTKLSLDLVIGAHSAPYVTGRSWLVTFAPYSRLVQQRAVILGRIHLLLSSSLNMDLDYTQ